MDFIDPKMLKAVLKEYRKDVPTFGEIPEAEVQLHLKANTTCRGWTTVNGRRQYFHIVRSTMHYPDKSVFYADTEQALVTWMILEGEKAGIDLEDLVRP